MPCRFIICFRDITEFADNILFTIEETQYRISAMKTIKKMKNTDN